MIFCWIPNNRPWGNFLLNYAMDYLHLLGLHRVPLSKDVTGVPHINSHWTPVLSKFKSLTVLPHVNCANILN